MGELNSVQAPIIEALLKVGWAHMPGDGLNRSTEEPFVETEVAEALIRLNPAIADDPSRVDEILPRLRTAVLGARTDGLVETNRTFAEWLRCLRDHEYVGTNGSVPVRLIDFDDPTNNRYVVSHEVTFGVPGDQVRFDLVLWVNGFPLAVGELKSPTDLKKSWFDGANDLAGTYQPEHPEIFVPNVVCFASEGKEFMYAAVGAPVENWMPWGPTSDTPKLAEVLAAAVDMLNPATLLDLLSDFTLYEPAPSNDDGPKLIKLVARYTQVEAVNLITKRALDPARTRGLIHHTQGSGKTLAMVFAAGKMLRDPRLSNPTIVVIADRVQLVRQAWEQFRTTSMPRLLVPSSASELHDLLAKDRRGLIFATVHKFAGAPSDLNTRENLVVLVDEAHRTQEGGLGMAMRAALPNATLIGFTGTPIAKLDRNTFETFGDESDEKRTLHTYDSDQSIADGMTVPIHVSPRLVSFHLDRTGLDRAMEEMARDEQLSDEEAELLTRRVSRTATFFSNPERVAAVCADLVDHFYATVDPLGMKAQVVVYDREACSAYYDEVVAQLAARGSTDEAAVVISAGPKDDDETLTRFKRSETEEEKLLRRFRTFGDPLKFLIVTAKLGTGFDAPIEGVLYLDKPLKEHTLFQTITRTNRTWRNPDTTQDKRYGLVVDYVGLGAGFARAMTPANSEQEKHNIDLEGLIDQFEAELKVAMVRFAGIDTTNVTAETLLDAQARFDDEADQQEFATQYQLLEGVWETAWPHERLQPLRNKYRFISQVYRSITPSGPQASLLWHRLGAKTLALVHSHMSGIEIRTANSVIVADASTIQHLIDEGMDIDVVDAEDKTADEIIDSIAGRLKRRLEGQNGDHEVWKSLGERLDKLRQAAMTEAEASINVLRNLFELAHDVTVAEAAEDVAGADGLALLPDRNVGALTQIFEEYVGDDAPATIGLVVNEVDQIVKQVAYDGWADTHKGDKAVRRELRNVLRRHLLHNTPGLFDRAYDYVRANY